MHPKKRVFVFVARALEAAGSATCFSLVRVSSQRRSGYVWWGGAYVITLAWSVTFFTPKNSRAPRNSTSSPALIHVRLWRSKSRATSTTSVTRPRKLSVRRAKQCLQAFPALGVKQNGDAQHLERVYTSKRRTRTTLFPYVEILRSSRNMFDEGGLCALAYRVRHKLKLLFVTTVRLRCFLCCIYLCVCVHEASFGSCAERTQPGVRHTIHALQERVTRSYALLTDEH